MGVFDIVSHAKEIADLVRKYDNLELQEKLLALREELLALTEENLSLKEQVRKFVQQQAIAVELVREGNVYYRQEGATKSGPYCMTCWDAERLLVNLSLSKSVRGGNLIRCGRCNKPRSRT